MSRFKKPSEFRGASFFKPKEFQTHLALLVEPKSVEENVPSEYRGVTRLRDEVIADITVFDNQASLDKGEPTEVIKSCKVVHGMLTDTLKKVLGEAIVAQVTTTETKNGSGYVWRDVDAETEEKVGAYWDKREAEVAAALDNAPDF